uniref:Uncharacterized protein n=1 Tax=Anopheles epiroticus TaxID=199890 RepID=A0A182PN79_9DIPT
MQAKCRLCLKKVGARKGLSINDSNFSTLLSRVFIFPVSQIEPNLPQGVCSRCVSTVRNFHDYSQEVQQNQTFLLQGLITKRKGSEEDHTKWEAAVTVKHEFPPDADDKTESFPELNDDEGEEDASDIIMPIEDVELTENEQEDFLSDDERSRNFDTLAPDDGNAIGRSRKSELHENDRIIQEFFKMRCELCPEQDEHSFDRFYTLQLHYRRQHQTRGYVRCCGVQLYRRFRVMEHIESHRGTIRCEICEKLFKSYSYLRRHMAERHLDGGIDRASYTCEHCKRKFSTAGQLTVHRQSHVTTVCKLCGKTVSMRYLKKHVALIHEAVRNWYMCDLCGKNFSSSMVLDRHIKHHQGIETLLSVVCTPSSSGSASSNGSSNTS